MQERERKFTKIFVSDIERKEITYAMWKKGRYHKILC
jgi:hypothetical protein